MRIEELIKPEIKFMCRFLTNTCDQDLFNSVDPKELLSVLKQHSLYPVFYHKWNMNLWSKADSSWIEFTAKLKHLVNQNRFRLLEKTSLLLNLNEKFRNDAVPVIFLKGPALSQRLYGDLTMRVSADLDILVKPEDFYKAVKVLEQAGFRNEYIKKEFTSKQSDYFFKNYRHITFSKDGSSQIELHWQLNHLGKHTELSNKAIWDRSAFVIIGEQIIRVLSENDEFLFLLMHGLSHTFHRLQWLYDLVKYEEKNISLSSMFYEKKEIKHLLDTYYTCKDLLFKEGSILEGRPNGFTVHFLKTITKPVPKYHILRNWNDAYGRILLSRTFLGKIKVFQAQLTSPKDWNLVSLNDRFFFMYFVLRPFLGFSRFFKKQEVK